MRSEEIKVNENTLVSVLLPIYKEPLDWVKKSVNSILGQTYHELSLVIIIDNPDREDVVQWLKSVDDFRVRYYVNERNIGLVDSLNKGISLCKGNYIARMDADDVSETDRIKKQLQYLRESGCDIVGCNVEMFNDNGTIEYSRLPKSPDKMSSFIRNGGSIPHPTWLLKKSVYSELGGYRNIKYAEDYDFLARAIIHGYCVGAVQDVSLRYRQNLNGISQEHKGEQKYVAKLIKEQLDNNMEYELELLGQKISDSQNELNNYMDYYLFTRSLKNSLVSKKLSSILIQITRFKVAYFDILQKDLSQGFCRFLVSR